MITVYTADDFTGMSVRISVVRTFTAHGLIDGPTHDRKILRIEQDDTGRQTSRWDDIPVGADVEPTLRIGQDEARALLDALTRHFHGAEDTRALRRDYDHERQRVDQLVGAVTQIASSLAAPPVEPVHLRQVP